MTRISSRLLLALAAPAVATLAVLGATVGPRAFTAAAPLGEPDQTFTLRTVHTDGSMAFQGKGGGIDGKLNPALRVAKGSVVRITLENGDGIAHDVSVPAFDATSAATSAPGGRVSVTFRADRDGAFEYFCTVLGHRYAGMSGRLEVGASATADAAAPVLSRAATDVPAPEARRAPRTIRVNLEAVEATGRLADGTSYPYWTFNGRVPGPMVRAHAGDRIEVTMRNADGASMTHSVDFHAATGPGGGGMSTQTKPGGVTSFAFTALHPGLYVYHCATAPVAAHVANGMYGLILVEPATGLPRVDREFYVMQGEVYSNLAVGEPGAAKLDERALADERPAYVVFNGASGSLTGKRAMHAVAGDTVRVFFGVGGPNLTSSAHVVGETFDRVYAEGSLSSAPLRDVQTTLVPAGGATMLEFKVDVPGTYTLLDHSLSRVARGLTAQLVVSGRENPDVFDGTVGEDHGH